MSTSPALGSVIQPCPLSKGVHWIEIELVGNDGSPVGGEAYQITLPDGKVAEGFLDGKGLARVKNIATPGDCRITFPRLDQAVWHPASGA